MTEDEQKKKPLTKEEKLHAERQQRERVQTWIASGCIASIGVGCWWLNPALGLIVPATIMLAGIVYGRTHS